MTSRDVIENKISSTRKFLGLLDRYPGYSKDEIQEDIDLKGACERYPDLAVQSTIDLAEDRYRFQESSKAGYHGRNLRILQEEGLLSAELAGKLARMAGFRNILAHAYEDIDGDVVYDVLQHRLKDLAEFLDITSPTY